MKEVKEGDRAPDFSLASQGGKTVSLHEYAGAKNVVLYFYPKDFTAGCTAEAIEYSANYEAIVRLDGEVIGVSSDNSDTHVAFAEKCNVKYPLLTDGGGKLREAYGVRASMGIVPGRVTFVIDKEGIVRRVFSSQIHPRRHVAEALDALRVINGGPDKVVR